MHLCAQNIHLQLLQNDCAIPLVITTLRLKSTDLECMESKCQLALASSIFHKVLQALNTMKKPVRLKHVVVTQNKSEQQNQLKSNRSLTSLST